MNEIFCEQMRALNRSRVGRDRFGSVDAPPHKVEAMPVLRCQSNLSDGTRESQIDSPISTRTANSSIARPNFYGEYQVMREEPLYKDVACETPPVGEATAPGTPQYKHESTNTSTMSLYKNESTNTDSVYDFQTYGGYDNISPTYIRKTFSENPESLVAPSFYIDSSFFFKKIPLVN